MGNIRDVIPFPRTPKNASSKLYPLLFCNFDSLMSMLNQKLQLKLSQKLSPQQIQLMKLINYQLFEFEQRLSREEDKENPALDTVNDNNEIEKDEFDFEENNEKQESSDDEIDISDYLTDDIPEYNLRTNNYSEENEKAIPYTAGTSFNQFLKNQLHSFFI